LHQLHTLKSLSLHFPLQYRTQPASVLMSQ
jgi:hypothetical protein